MDRPFNFDLDRMRKSVESGTVSFPRGIGRARQQFLRDDNRRFTPPNVDSYHGAECVRGLILG
jgi:hypothetical protein